MCLRIFLRDIYGVQSDAVGTSGSGRPGGSTSFIINSCTLQPAVTKITIMTTAKRFSGAPTKRQAAYCSAAPDGSKVGTGQRS